MAMTLTEAVAVNTLARFLLELDVARDPRGPVLPEEARKALGDLAASAHKKLAAGTDRERVLAAAWRIALPTPGSDTETGLDRYPRRGEGGRCAECGCAPSRHGLPGGRCAACVDGRCPGWTPATTATAICGQMYAVGGGLRERACTEPPGHTTGGCRRDGREGPAG